MSQPRLAIRLCAVICLILSASVQAQDRYFGDFDGTWDVASSWEGSVVPSSGENAFLVRPYFGLLPVIQPVIIDFRAATDPDLDGLVIESGNWLIQNDNPGFDALSSNFETIGGYNGTLTGLFDQTELSRHFQNGGTNNIATFLTLGQNSDSEGLYRLSGGDLTSAVTIAGEEGRGDFVMTGGLLSTTNFVLGQQSSGIGSLYLDGGELETTNYMVVGDAGLGFVVHTGDADATINGSLILGRMETGSGDYDFSSTAKLNLLGGLVVHRGVFRQTLGDVDIRGNLRVDSEGRYLMSSSTNDLTVSGDVDVSGDFEMQRGNLTVGSNSVIHGGLFEQSLGTHQVERNLQVGTTLGETASYDLSGGVLNVDTDVTVGSLGFGSIIHSGSGDATVGRNLVLGSDSADGTGDYDFSSSVNLKVLGDLQVKRGTFRQISGGVDTTGDLVVESTGRYEMTGSLAEQSVTGNLNVAGQFDLQAGRLLVGANTEVSQGSFDQASGELRPNRSLWIGNAMGETADYHIRQEGAELLVNENEYIGINGSTGNLVQEAGFHQINGALVLGYEATFTPLPIVEDEIGIGHFTISGDARSDQGLTAGRLHIADSGYEPGLLLVSTFVQNGGEVRIGAEIVVGAGSYELNSGTLQCGRLSDSDPLRIYYGANALIVGGWVRGNDIDRDTPGLSYFLQTGGMNLVGGNLTIGAHDNTSGVFTMTGGSLRVNGDLIVKVDGLDPPAVGTYYQYGATANVLGDAVNHGIFSMTDGAEMIVGGSYVNHGSSLIGSGSTMTTSDDTFLNFGSLKIEGTATNTVNGSLVNHANVNLQDTNVRFSGKFTNRAAIVSTHSESTFQELVVEQEGYIQAGANDRFVITGDFANGSLKNNLWNTRQSSLKFDGTVAHLFGLAGDDEGANVAGFSNNFAWGELELVLNETLTLFDANPIDGAALYLGVLNLEDIGQLNTIFSDFNIYYDSTRQENQYLDGQSYTLNGSGRLIPVAVPEPTGVLLPWLIGLSFITMSRRRPCRYAG